MWGIFGGVRSRLLFRSPLQERGPSEKKLERRSCRSRLHRFWTVGSRDLAEWRNQPRAEVLSVHA
jgi:hypothetical protein